MIEKITDFGSLSGVSSPLLPLIFADGFCSRNEYDGAFLQKAESGELQAVFSLKNTCITLLLVNDNGAEELGDFFSFCGVTEILSDKPVTHFCNNQKELNFFEFLGELADDYNCQTLTPKSIISEYRDVYNVVSEHGNNFENWFPEFSKKINSSNAFATYLKVNENTVSVAISPAVYENTAIIAGVFTLNDYRNKGYASKCVKSLVSEMKRNNISKIYLWCEDKNIQFYNNLNFKYIKKIYFGECN